MNKTNGNKYRRNKERKKKLLSYQKRTRTIFGQSIFFYYVYIAGSVLLSAGLGERGLTPAKFLLKFIKSSWWNKYQKIDPLAIGKQNSPFDPRKMLLSSQAHLYDQI